MLAAAAALALALVTIGTALAFETWGGYAPCPLCLQQRYAYYAAIPAAAAALVAVPLGAIGIARLLLAAIALGFLFNAGLGAYHAGIEWHWWQGPASCVLATNLSGEPGDLLSALAQTRVVRCDEAPWRFLGLSFAGWNVAASALLAGIAAFGATRKR